MASKLCLVAAVLGVAPTVLGQPALSANANSNMVAEANDFVLSSATGTVSLTGLSTAVSTAASNAGVVSNLVATVSTALSSQVSLNAAQITPLSNQVSTLAIGAGSMSTLAGQLGTTQSTMSLQVGSLSTFASAAGPLQTALSTAVSTTTTVLGQTSTLVGTMSTTQRSMSSAISSILSQLAPPPPPATLPISCRDLLERNSSLRGRSGQYMVQPHGLAPLRVYCDMDFYGGGWTLVLKSNAGRFSTNPSTSPYFVPTAQAMYNMVADPVNNKFLNEMTTPDFPYLGSGAPYYMASLNRPYTNGIANFTVLKGQVPVVRVDLKRNDGNRGSVGTYMQGLSDYQSDFDYWQSLRDSRPWTNYTVRGSYLIGFGADFGLAKNPASFSNDGNRFLHDTCQDASFGVWGATTVTVSGQQVTLSKHGGLLGDGHCNQGNLWLLTLLASDGRFRNDNVRQASVFIR